MNQSTLPFALDITGLTHDGRGVATYDERFGDKAGKKVFISHALPQESVHIKITHTQKHFDEADSTHLITKSAHRTNPICPHFGVCGGCSLQHFDADEQIKFKQSVLENHLAKSALAPDVWLAPIIADRTHYRTKARLGVRYLAKTDQLIIGFRQRASNFLTDIDTCPIMDKQMGDNLTKLKNLLGGLRGKNHITHLEIAIGEATKSATPHVALIIRHLKPLTKADLTKLIAFGQAMRWQIFLQPKGADSVQRIDDPHGRATSLTVPPTGGLFYELPEFDVVFEFSPLDFTQVNLSVNRKMTKLACELLDLQQGERVLDLFCGLGNFSLPLARCVGSTGKVIGVEGSVEMVKRAKMNALANGIPHANFYAQDLTQDFSGKSWVGEVDALLIDPPRSGAKEVMGYLGKFNAKRIVYVSCDPATLARDTALLVAQGYRLTHAGVMDMFCHTAHVESIARFEKIKTH